MNASGTKVTLYLNIQEKYIHHKLHVIHAQFLSIYLHTT